MLMIQNEAIIQQLESIAQREQRSVDAVLHSLLAQYTPSAKEIETVQTVQRLRQQAYKNARHYWQETQQLDRLRLSDAELDQQFWLFDSVGIPRLISDKAEAILEPGTSAYIAVQLEAGIGDWEDDFDTEYSDDVLEAEFANYLLERIKNGSGTDFD
jgi:hypothetical protein